MKIKSEKRIRKRLHFLLNSMYQLQHIFNDSNKYQKDTNLEICDSFYFFVFLYCL